MLAQRISSINSFSALCEKTGANVDQLSEAIGMDHRIGPHFLRPSVGFGGSCFQKDILNLVYICKHYGLNEVAEYWHQVVKINNYQKNRFAYKIIDHFGGDLNGKRIAILGWAFKAYTNDSRESPAIKVSKLLLEKGATLKIFDPMVKSNRVKSDLVTIFKETGKNEDEIKLILRNIEITDSIDKAIKKANAIGILTEWDLFKKFDWRKATNVKIFDGRNILGENFYSIGIP